MIEKIISKISNYNIFNYLFTTASQKYSDFLKSDLYGMLVYHTTKQEYVNRKVLTTRSDSLITMKIGDMMGLQVEI